MSKMFSSFSGMRATDKGLNVLDSILPELLSSLDRHQDSGLESRVTDTVTAIAA